MRKIIGVLAVILIMITASACDSDSETTSTESAAAGAASAVTAEMTWQDYYDLGIRYLSEGNYQEAIIAFTAAIEIEPKQPTLYMGRGDAYVAWNESADHLQSACDDYKTVIELEETNIEAYLKLADVYVLQGESESALRLLEDGYTLTGAKEVLEKIQEISEKLYPKTDFWVLTEQKTYNAYKEPVSTNCYEYDEKGYHIKSDSVKSGAVELWEYDDARGIWIHSWDGMGTDPASGQEENLIHLAGVTYWPISKAGILLNENSGMYGFVHCGGKNAVNNKEEGSRVVYNEEYGEHGYPGAIDWHYAEYIVDEHGNVVTIKSYSQDGKLLGTCELTYKLINVEE